MSTISLEGMEFFAHHGCFKEEQVIGNKFIIDLQIETDTMEAEISDNLAKTINYQEVYLVVKEEMATRSKLLEHIASRILNRISHEFPQITSARIKVSKLNPPVGGKVDRVSVEMKRPLV